jgi:hypothetical protein
LVVFPVLLGSGERVFGPLTDQKALRLIGNRRLGDGLALLSYEASA